jgi:hypothetical protein
MTSHRCGACAAAAHQCALCETRDALYRANAIIGQQADEMKAMQDKIDQLETELRRQP